MRRPLVGKGMGRNKIHRQALHFHRYEFFASHSIADTRSPDLLLVAPAIASAIAGDIRADPILAPRATSRCFVQKEIPLLDTVRRRQNREDRDDAIRRDRPRHFARPADASCGRADRRCELNMDGRPKNLGAARCVRLRATRVTPKKTRRRVSRQIARGNPTPSCSEEYTGGGKSSNCGGGFEGRERVMRSKTAL